MTFEENEKIKSVIRKRLVELHPENCEYCGGFHQMRLSRDGMTIVSSNGICSELLVRANKIIRDTRAENGDPYYKLKST